MVCRPILGCLVPRGLSLSLSLFLSPLLFASSAAAQWPPPPTLPDAPAGSTCVFLQRGTLGEVQDADVGLGNGTWAAGAYPYTWTGVSPYDHWSIYRFDLSPIPQGAQVVLAAFSPYVSWNEQSSQVRLHRITAPWNELSVTWQNFGGAASWDPAVIATFDGSGVGHKTVDVTSLVQAWKSGVHPNHGLLLEEDPVKLHGYFSSESGTANLRPSLYVCYTAAAGGPCAGKPEGAACNDGNSCTTGEICQAGQCTAGQPLACAPLDDCHEAGVCDPATGQCSIPEKQDGAPCNDGDLCTTGDYCVSGICLGPTPVSCFDGSACTSEVCDPAVGCVSTTVSCDDGNACTADGCDPAGGCTHDPVVCDDDDACTANSCDPLSGCAIAPISCDDGNACTSDGCDADTGCFATPMTCTGEGCGAACAADHAAGVCDLGACGIAACDPGWGNCDCSLSNGCEAGLLTDPQNCGVCGLSCATAGGTGVCLQGTCVAP